MAPFMWIIGYPIFDKNIWLFEYLTPTLDTFYSIRHDSDFWLFEYIRIRLLSIRSITSFSFYLFSISKSVIFFSPIVLEICITTGRIFYFTKRKITSIHYNMKRKKEIGTQVMTGIFSHLLFIWVVRSRLISHHLSSFCIVILKYII